MEQATENPGVGGSIPPLATKLLAMERQVFLTPIKVVSSPVRSG